MGTMAKLAIGRDITPMVIPAVYSIFAQPFIEPSAYLFLMPPIFGAAEVPSILVYAVLEVHGPGLLQDHSPAPAWEIANVPSKLTVIGVNILPGISLGCCENHLIVLEKFR